MSARMSPAELRALAEREAVTDMRTVAAATGWSRGTLMTAYHAGMLPFPAHKVGRSVKVPVRPLLAFLGLDDQGDAKPEARVRLASVDSVAAGQRTASGFVNRSGGGDGAA